MSLTLTGILLLVLLPQPLVPECRAETISSCSGVFSSSSQGEVPVMTKGGQFRLGLAATNELVKGLKVMKRKQ